jgi:hypothetical protein
MKLSFMRRAAVLSGLGVGLLFSAAASAHETVSPEVRQVGATAVVYKGPQVEVALSYRYVKNNLKGDWLFLDTEMTASTAPLEIPRAAFSLRTPSGDVVQLASQSALALQYAKVNADLHRDNATHEPLGYLLPQRARRLRLFVEPGRGVVFDSTWLDQWHNNYGRLFFEVPGGLQRGDYALLIHLKEGDVSIPFTL